MRWGAVSVVRADLAGTDVASVFRDTAVHASHAPVLVASERGWQIAHELLLGRGSHGFFSVPKYPDVLVEEM